MKSNSAIQAPALQHNWPLSSPILQYKLLHYNTTGHSQVQPCSTSCSFAIALVTYTSNFAVQTAALQHHWPLSTTTLQHKLLHCNSTGDSPFLLCSTSCYITIPLATFKYNRAIQATALQHHWPLSCPTLQYKHAALQQHWPLSTPTLQYKLLHCNTADHSRFQTCSRFVIRDFVSMFVWR